MESPLQLMCVAAEVKQLCLAVLPFLVVLLQLMCLAAEVRHLCLAGPPRLVVPLWLQYSVLELGPLGWSVPLQLLCLAPAVQLQGQLLALPWQLLRLLVLWQLLCLATAIQLRPQMQLLVRQLLHSGGVLQP